MEAEVNSEMAYPFLRSTQIKRKAYWSSNNQLQSPLMVTNAELLSMVVEQIVPILF